MYNYKIFDSINDECESLWKNAKQDSQLTLTFFQDFDFIKEVSKANNTDLKIVFIFKDEKIILILPLEIKKYYFFRVLQWAGTGYSDFCNAIFFLKYKSDLNKEDFLELWKKILLKIGRYDVIYFNNQLSNIENLDNPFVKFFKTSKFSLVYKINLNGEFSDYKSEIQNKDKKHFYELHRTILKQKNLEEQAKVQFKVTNSITDNFKIDSHILQKRKQLTKKGAKNNLSEVFINIFDNLIKQKKISFLKMNLEINSETISSCFGFIFKDSFYYHVPVLLSNKYNKFKPGKILIIYILNWCIENKIKKFNFGLGAEKYKKYLSNHSTSLHRYINFQTFKGFFVFLFINFVLKIKRFLT
tara:strand:- start:1849 stop:2919 length:1071 start_codon:yes stop_codon:yes gene_type:complete